MAVVDDGSVAEGVVAQVTHTVAGGDYGESGVAVAPVPVMVTAARVVLTVSPERVAEDATGVVQTVTATLNGGTRATDTNVTVSVSGDTATAGDDFLAVPDFTLTIPAGASSGTGTFTLAPVDDAVDELDETVTVSGTAPGVTAPPGVAVTITDNDERGVTVTPQCWRCRRGRVAGAR